MSDEAVNPQSTNQPVFSYQDKFGSVELRLDGQILISTFTGPISASLARRYSRALYNLVPYFGGQPWAYVTSSRDFEAATQEALGILEGVYKICITNGCVADAYILKSPVGIAQLGGVRAKLKMPIDMSQVLFNDLDDARTYLQQILEQVKSGLSVE